MNSFVKTILALIISMFCTELSAKVAQLIQVKKRLTQLSLTCKPHHILNRSKGIAIYNVMRLTADYITICPGLKADCLKDNIQRTIPHFVKGEPNLGLDTIDPVHIDHFKFNLPGDLKIEFYNGTLTGPRKCIVDSVKYENYVADLNMHCAFYIKGKYKAKGKVVLFSLDGEGDAKIKAKKIIVHSKLFFEDKIRDGVEYHEVKNIKTDYRFGDRVSFLFTNLLKGNPELSKTILAFLNENWDKVVGEFGRPIIDEVLPITLNVVKKFFKVIPKAELIA